MCSDKRNFIYRVHKDHRNPGNRWNVNFRHGNIFKIWAKNRRPCYTCVVWEIGAKSCTVCQFFLKLNSFLKVLAHIPTLPAYTGFFWIWHKNLPVFSTGHPTQTCSNMSSVYIMFSAQYFGSSGLKISKVDTLVLKNIVYTEPFLIGNVFWLCLPTLWSIVLFLLSHELTKKLTNVG